MGEVAEQMVGREGEPSVDESSSSATALFDTRRTSMLYVPRNRVINRSFVDVAGTIKQFRKLKQLGKTAEETDKIEEEQEQEDGEKREADESVEPPGSSDDEFSILFIYDPNAPKKKKEENQPAETATKTVTIQAPATTNNDLERDATKEITGASVERSQQPISEKATDETNAGKLLLAAAARRRGKRKTKSSRSEVAEMTPGEKTAAFNLEFSKGMISYKQGSYKQAITCLSKALDIRVEDKYCLVIRAKCYLRLGNSIEALQDAESSLKSYANFPQGLITKAEALYQMGKFEMALVYYHRGFHSRPEMHEFKVGIQKTEEALRNTVGRTDVFNYYSNKSAQTSHHAGDAPPESLQGDGRRRKDSEKVSKLLLGRLYKDKQFLGNLLKEEENRSIKHAKENASDVIELCSDGLSYLDNRTQFWSQQNPIVRRQDRQAAGLTDQEIRDMYLNRLAYVDLAFHRGDYDGTLANARRLETHVMKEPDVTFQYKPEIIAFIDHFIGNSLLEKGDHANAMEYFNKERAYGEDSNLPEAKSRAFDDIGRTYARMGDYNKAIDIWSQKLNGQTCSLLAKTWLYHEIGRCYYELGNFSTALDYASRALGAAKAESNRKWILNCNILAAQSYIQMNDFENALEQFDHAYDLTEGDVNARQAVKVAMEQVSMRIREEYEATLATYRINLSLSSLEYVHTRSEAFIAFTDVDGKRTGFLSLGSFDKSDWPTSVDLFAKQVGTRIGDMSRADLWVDGCTNFIVPALIVVDCSSGKRCMFDGINGAWSVDDEDATKRIWKMAVQVRKPKDHHKGKKRVSLK